MKKILLIYYYVFLEGHTKKSKPPYWFFAFAQVVVTIFLFLFPIFFGIEDFLNIKLNWLGTVFFLGVIPSYIIYLLLFDIFKFDKFFNEDKKRELSITKKTVYAAYFVYISGFIYLFILIYIYYPPRQ